MTTKNKTLKSISALLIILIIVPAVLFSKPNRAEATGWPVMDILGNILLGTTGASTAANTAISVKNVAIEILRQIVMTVERRLLQEMTNSTVKWINSGFHGNPLYLENSDSFFKDIAKYEVKNIVDMFGYDSLKYPFGKDFALSAINAYKTQAADDAAYSLSTVINDPNLLNSFQNNFNVGGWNGFLINTQYQQNNYLGFQMIATERLAQHLQGLSQTAGQKTQQALQQGMGFLAPQTCPSNPKYNNLKNEFNRPEFNMAEYIKNNPPPSPEDTAGKTFTVYAGAGTTTTKLSPMDEWTKNLNDAKTVWGIENSCPGGLVTTTPGSVVANQLTGALGSTFRQSELGAALGNSIGAILDAFLNHFLDKGLNSLTNAVNQAPTLDNWSYYGNTLGGEAGTNTIFDNSGNPTTASGATAPLAADMEDVAVQAGKVVNVNLSGGLAPYNIETNPNAAMAVGFISDTTLMVAGIAPGHTSIKIADSSSATQTVTIQITVSEGSGVNATDITPVTNLQPPANNQSACTQLGQDEQDFMLPLLRDGTPPGDVVNQNNEKFSAQMNAIGELGAAYLPGQNAVELPEFFLVGNTDTDPNSPPPGEWTVSKQCSDKIIIPAPTSGSSSSSSSVNKTTPPSANPPTITPTEKSLGAGTFPDVAFYNNRVYLAVQQGPSNMVLYNFATDLTDQKQQTIPYFGDQGFPRLTVYNNILWLAFRGDQRPNYQSGIKLWRSDTGAIEDLGGGMGNDPVALQNGYVAWQKLQPDGITWKVVRRALTGGAITVVRDSLPTGISRILPDGTVKMINDDLSAIPGNTKPWWAGNLAVMQGNSGGVIGLFNGDPATSFIWWPGRSTYAPHDAFDGNNLYAITTSIDYHDVRIAVLQAPQ